jgi:hypothetical protein
MKTIDEQIAELEEQTRKKVRQLKAKKELIEARKVHALIRGKRSDDTRRKILAGAMTLEISGPTTAPCSACRQYPKQRRKIRAKKPSRVAKNKIGRKAKPKTLNGDCGRDAAKSGGVGFLCAPRGPLKILPIRRQICPWRRFLGLPGSSLA